MRLGTVRVLRKWWPSREDRAWILVRVGGWRELRRWPVPGRIFEWSGYLPDLWYFIKCAIWYRYDRLDIPTLSPTWNEWDNKLLHAAFAVFSDYATTQSQSRWTVAQLEAEIANPEADRYSREWCISYLPDAREVEVLHHWWTVERDQDHREEEAALTRWHDVFEAAGGMGSEPTDNPRLGRLVFPESVEADELSDAHRAIEERNEAKDEEMLIRLMKIRHVLWT